jgi:hypothetical protein
MWGGKFGGIGMGMFGGMQMGSGMWVNPKFAGNLGLLGAGGSTGFQFGFGMMGMFGGMSMGMGNMLGLSGGNMGMGMQLSAMFQGKL